MSKYVLVLAVLVAGLLLLPTAAAAQTATPINLKLTATSKWLSANTKEVIYKTYLVVNGKLVALGITNITNVSGIIQIQRSIINAVSKLTLSPITLEVENATPANLFSPGHGIFVRIEEVNTATGQSKYLNAYALSCPANITALCVMPVNPTSLTLKNVTAVGGYNIVQISNFPANFAIALKIMNPEESSNVMYKIRISDADGNDVGAYGIPVVYSEIVLVPAAPVNITTLTKTLNVQVIDAQTGKPIANANVTLKTLSGAVLQRARTGSDGYVSFNGVLPGTYVLEVKAAGYRVANAIVAITQDMPATVNITVSLLSNKFVIASLIQRIDNIESMLTALENKVNKNLVPQIEELKAKLEQIKSELVNVRTNISQINATITKLEELVSSNTANITAIKATVNALQAQVALATLLSAASTIASIGNLFYTFVVVGGQINALQHKIQQLNATIQNLTKMKVPTPTPTPTPVVPPSVQQAITQLQQKVSTLQAEVTALRSRLSTLQSQLSMLQTRYTELASMVARLQTQVSQLRAELANLRTSIAAVQNAAKVLAQVQALANTVKAELANMRNQIMSINETVAMLQKKVESLMGLKKEIASLANRVSKLESEVSMIKSELATKASKAEVEALKSKVEEAVSKADEAYRMAKEAKATAQKVASNVQQALNTAQMAYNMAKDASSKAESAMKKADAAQSTATAAIGIAVIAIIIAIIAIGVAASARKKAAAVH